MTAKSPSLLKRIGPGILIAATGVGAGDLATAAFTGSHLHETILWAVLLGAGLKFVLTEGLARWQLATGETLLEGVSHRYGRVVDYLFLGFLLIWTALVSCALMSACGVAFHAILPLMEARSDKILYGIIHSAAAVFLVRWGGYRLFEKIMGVCIAIMFVTVIATAVAVGPDWSAVLRGMFLPSLENFNRESFGWTIALMGGIGGTLTVVCYGYWIREEGRTGVEDVKLCRVDLATGYAMTAVFGLCMVILGSRLSFEGDAKGAQLVVMLADLLRDELGPAARWAFLIGAWGAVFSSLLGVWQCIPYLFADFLRIAKREEEKDPNPIDINSPGYKIYLYGMATLPILGLLVTEFQSLQKYNAILGAAVMPMLAVTLLLLNGKKKWVGEKYQNAWFTNVILVLTLVFFLVFIVVEASKLFG